MNDLQSAAHSTRPGRLLTAVLTCVLSSALTPLHADPLDAANRLLDASGTAEHFQRRTALQTSAIIRHYQVIVGTSSDITLPRSIREAISECYAREYHWDNFADGIARILASKLSPRQMRLLTDFYLSRSLPPSEIDAFKATIAMATEIERASADFILANSGSCVEQDARLILHHLREHTGASASD